MCLLNENDMNNIYTDTTRSFVYTRCLCLVLEEDYFLFFSPTMGKQAFIVLTYRKGARFSLLYIIQSENSAAKIVLSNLSPNLSAYA